MVPFAGAPLARKILLDSLWTRGLIYEAYQKRSGSSAMPFLTIIFFSFLFLTTILPLTAADSEQLDGPRLSDSKQDVLFVGEAPKKFDVKNPYF